MWGFKIDAIISLGRVRRCGKCIVCEPRFVKLFVVLLEGGFTD